ncbi:MAG: hypothetical protein ALECFALPRED_011061 [Alectoria fallacina]|uniref:Uncharacterized protein n=1 Tax=Alectoria fallacina TaxID=1903189 RepID=A0A8H3F3W6_9LECA|nr:MAG: hypothetical protein ALECFALPRED_011061 [Alectoria fallacina]
MTALTPGPFGSSVIDYHWSEHLYINRLMAVFGLEDCKLSYWRRNQNDWRTREQTLFLRRQDRLSVRWCPLVPARSTRLSFADNHIMRSPFFPSPVSSSVLLFYIARVASLSLNPPQLLTPKPPATLTSPNSSANASLADGRFASSSILSHLIIQCDASEYGHGLNYDSCHDAYDQIPHFVSEMTWGPRTQGRWTVNLPWRAYSSNLASIASIAQVGAEAQGHTADGLCAINVSSRSGVAVSDKASWYRIAQAAFEVLEQCVRPETWGGSLKNLGQKSNLIVSVLSYTPHVHCSAPRAAPPTIKACAELQNRMFASADALVFGPMEEPGVEAGLPQSWLLPTSAADLGSCAMVVNTRGPLDTASWFDVWAGAGAVAAMCVRRGLVGISTGQDGIKMLAPSLRLL